MWSSSRSLRSSTLLAGTPSSVAFSQFRWSSSSNSSNSPGPGFDIVEKTMLTRRSCRSFDTERPVSGEMLDRILTATIRSPTGFNLQGWTCVVVTNPKQRSRLHKAALSQPAVASAPVTVVFAGQLDPSGNAPLALELGLKSRYYRSSYGSSYLRAVNYMLHSGPGEAMNGVKAGLSRWYSHASGNAQLGVPTSMQAYAWKQCMIPATNFVTLSTAAGLSTCCLEGIDEDQVKDVVGLPREQFTVPIIVCCGYPTAEVVDEEVAQGTGLAGANNKKARSDPLELGSKGKAFHPVLSPRFDRSHFVHLNNYQRGKK